MSNGVTMIERFTEAGGRTVMRNDVPWFVLEDACDIFELGNPLQVLATVLLDSSELSEEQVETSGGKITTPVVNESGLYALAFASDTPVAMEFQYWITHEILPSLRRAGKFGLLF